MKNARLLSTVAAALLLSTAVVSAQGMKDKDEAPGRAPAAQQNAPAEKVAPNMKPGQQNASQPKRLPETTGQATPKASDVDKAHPVDKDKGTAAKSSSEDKGRADVKTKSETSPTATSPKSSQSTTEQRTTTGQAAGSVRLSTEQRSKITTIIKQQKVEPAHINVSVRVGSRVPDSVHFYPLPQEVYVIYPEWRGYNYIMVGNEIVVIDPRTHEIVAILEA